MGEKIILNDNIRIRALLCAIPSVNNTKTILHTLRETVTNKWRLLFSRGSLLLGNIWL